ncbi:retinoid-inducible serine carboxypeptidase-like [Drosophila subpulchrella]|uniref:retinoid-inducible serine carboxypeptidase-like n=1 Tax=Drosophila subpulchrella TaxID=1486046 RepID=UPI0018A178B4|nr:retinoid-inducible serine carboxypeptidase-like [Drosophila subpulchrella]
MQLNLTKNIIWVCALCVMISYIVPGRVGLGSGVEEWDYVEVREGAHLFYWLLYTTANVTSFTERPLVVWLQGEPGVASTGSGIFEQLGPTNIEGRARQSSWVQHVNVLFVEEHGRYARNNRQIALDLVQLMEQFLKKYPAFRTVPLHIFSESYGGKMAPEFALELHLAKKRGRLDCQLKSVAVGNPWTSPLDSVLSYAPFLLQAGIVDDDGYRRISRLAGELAGLVYAEMWLRALMKASEVQEEISSSAGGVFIYNTQRRVHVDEVYRYGEDPKMSHFMRSNVTRALGLAKMPVWMEQNSTVFERLGQDIFKPSNHKVNRNLLLEETPIQVGLCSGILDLFCATPGTVSWIRRLKWTRRSEYAKAPRTAFRIEGMLEGYEKHGGRLSMMMQANLGKNL